MNIIEITDALAPETRIFFGLTDAQLRSRQHPEEALVIAEGPKVVRTAIQAGLTPVAALVRKKMLGGPAEEILAGIGDIPVYTGEDETLAALTGFRLQRAWVLCAFRRPRPWNAAECVRGARRVAYLEGLNEPSNVGAIFRAAAALSQDAVLLSPDCADPFHRRAVRVCMGAVFSLPWAFADCAEAVRLLKAEGFVNYGMALREPCDTLGDPALRAGKTALFFGTEDTGLTGETMARMDRIVRIPMARGIDSLNVATAAAIGFWEMRRSGTEIL